jgi:hypothetical protein
MKRFLNTIRFNCLTLDLIFLTIAVLLLAQTNSVQPSISHPTQSTPLQEPRLQNASKSGWWIVAGVAGGVGCIGFAILQHKRQTALRTTRNLQEMTPEEDTYFG